MKHIHYVSQTDDTFASYRLRIKMPAEELSSKGLIRYTIGSKPDPEAHINVFSKHYSQEQDLEFVRADYGTKTVFDICDDNFDHPDHSRFYLTMAASADQIVCNSEHMAKRVHENVGREATVIGDPYSYEATPPRDHTPFDPEIVWFGNRANLDSILKAARDNISHDENIKIISSLMPRALQPNLKFRVWYLGVEFEERGHITVIPKIDKPEALAKSTNRAVDALMTGSFVVTNFPEVYGPLQDFVYIGDLQDGIYFYKMNPLKAMQMIAAGQQFIRNNYSIEKNIAPLWYEEVFK